MRNASLLLTLVLASCSEASPDVPDQKPTAPPIERNGDPGKAGMLGVDLPEPDPLGPPLAAAPAAIKLADDAVMLSGVTSDGWVVYRSSQGIVAIPADGSTDQPTLISSKVGMVHVIGPVVFVFANVDWATNLGDLTIWTAAHGVREIGPAVYGDDAMLVSADGSWLGWIGNPSPIVDDESDPTADVILSTPAVAEQYVALPQIGMGSKYTCRPRLGFVGQRLFAAWCTPGSTAATLQVLDAPEFAPTTIATESTTGWSSDLNGETAFWTDPKGGAWMRQVDAAPAKLDNGVGWGTISADASVVLYTVGDQLRRAQAPSFTPTPIITKGFAGRAAMSPDLGHALYSTKVVYENGVTRDLLITPTHELNFVPTRLVDEPVAELTRSVFTTDGKWVIYLLRAGDGTKSLELRSVKTSYGRNIANVDTALAAFGSRIVYSTNRSGPETWPITADLVIVDPSAEGEPVVLATTTTDGRAYHLSPDGKRVFYAMPAQGETPSAVYAQDLP